MDLRETIKERMADLGWNVTRLAMESNVSKSSIYDFLAGRHGMYADHLERILKALDFTLTVITPHFSPQESVWRLDNNAPIFVKSLEEKRRFQRGIAGLAQR